MFSCDMPFAPERNLDRPLSSYLLHGDEITRLDRVAACLALLECPVVDIVAYWIGPLVDVAVIAVQPDSGGGILRRSGMAFAPHNEQPPEIQALRRVSGAEGCVVDVDLKYAPLFLALFFILRGTHTHRTAPCSSSPCPPPPPPPPPSSFSGSSLFLTIACSSSTRTTKRIRTTPRVRLSSTLPT